MTVLVVLASMVEFVKIVLMDFRVNVQKDGKVLDANEVCFPLVFNLTKVLCYLI